MKSGIKRITTTIPKETYDAAAKHGIKLSIALSKGIWTIIQKANGEKTIEQISEKQGNTIKVLNKMLQEVNNELDFQKKANGKPVKTGKNSNIRQFIRVT